ncbi:MAG: GldG family protein [Desulfococcaceae bacterium]
MEIKPKESEKTDSKTDTKKPLSLGGKSLFSAGGLLLVLAILVMVNVLFAGVNLRWDATEDNLYSLSGGSKQILSDLKQDVTIKVYYTQDVENIPVHIKNYANRMLDFLKEYENYGKGKVKVEIYNPKPDSEEEEWAGKYGMEGANLPTGDKVYFGLVALAGDQEEAIPMLDPTREEQLEYDITRIISRVQSSKKKKISIISSLPVFGQPPTGFMQQPQQGMQPWLFVEELKKAYDVNQISPSEKEIAADTDLLILIHPKETDPGLEYAIDQYVLKGGNLIVFADPMALSDTAQQPGRPPMNASNVKKLFDAWGIEMDMGKVVADFDYPTRLRTQNNQVEENPMWLSVSQGAFNTGEIVTGQLEGMLFPVAGAIVKKSDSKYEYAPLVQSSTNSALTESFKAQFGGGQMLRRDFKATVEKYDLVARVRGKFKTAFPGGKPKADPAKEGEDLAPDKDADAKHLTEGEKTATIIVVADADMLFDDYYVSNQNFLGFKISRMFNDNLNFLLNTGEMLTGTEALISIRTRGKFERPFTTVQDLEKKAQVRWLAREQELIRKVEDTNQKLRQLETQKDASQKLIMSPEQEAEIRNFQEEKIRINKELKEVRRNLRADIESLGTVLKFINIFLMVFVVAFGGGMYALYRRNKSVSGGESK